MSSLLLIVSAAALAAAQDDGFGGAGGGGMPDFGQQKNCPPFRCTSDHSAVPKSRQKFESSGCNSMGGGMQMFAPGAGNSGSHIDPCCDKWNACYQICGSSKQHCDEEFKKCGENTCGKLSNEEEKKNCNQSASLNSMMISMGPCRMFDEAQKTACTCVKSSKVTDYRKDAIRGFYKKYAPDALDDDKVKTLAEKANTRAKMAGLFRKLVAKYPKCIKKVKDPQQAYMEDMMKKVKEEKKDEGTESDVVDDSEETQEL